MNARIIPFPGPAGINADSPSAGVLVTAVETAGQLAMVELHLDRGAEPPLRRHHHEDLLIHIVEGELVVHIDGAAEPVTAGSWVLVPRGSEHGFALTSASARLVVIVTPAGAEACLGALYGAGIEEMVLAAARHGIDITGPPPLAP